MNKIYKVIWSKAKNCYVVVSEIAKRNGKCSSSLNKKIVAAFLAAGLVTALPMSVDAEEFNGGTGVTDGGDKSNNNAWGVLTYADGGNSTAWGNLSSTLGFSFTRNGDPVTITYNSTSTENKFVAYDSTNTRLASGETMQKLVGNLLKLSSVTFTRKSGLSFMRNGAPVTITYNSTEEKFVAYDSDGVRRASGETLKEVENKLLAFSTVTYTFTPLNATAFGSATIASGLNSTAFGERTFASSNNSTAFGARSKATANQATAFGFKTEASADNATAWGHETTASDKRATAFGIETMASGRNSTSFGYSTTAIGENATAFGSGTVASGGGATSWGTDTQAKAETSTTWGNSSIVHAGRWNDANGNLLYSDVEVLRDTSLPSGEQYYIVGIDSDEKRVTIQEKIATRAAADNLIRENGRIGGYNSTAFGMGSQTYAENALAALGGTVGQDNSNAGLNSAAIGLGSDVKSSNSYAMGRGATIGENSNGSVALGGNGNLKFNGTEYSDLYVEKLETTTKEGKTTKYAVIGIDGDGNMTTLDSSSDSREAALNKIAADNPDHTKIVGNATNAFAAVGGQVMDGAKNAVAIGEGTTVSSPYAYAMGNKATIETGSDGSVALGGKDDEKTTVGRNATNSFAAIGGQVMEGATNAVAMGGTVSGQFAIAIGHSAQAIKPSSTALGKNAQATEENSTALGYGAIANHTNSVALGSESESAEAVRTTTATVGGITYGNFAGSSPTSVVSIGTPDKKRQLINVAAGRIAPTSTDAVNGSQLYAAYDQLQWQVGIGKNGGTNTGGDLPQSTVGKLSSTNDKSNVQFIAGEGIDISSENIRNGYGIKVSLGESAKIATDNRNVALTTNEKKQKEITSPFIHVEGVAKANKKDYASATGADSIAIGRAAQATKANSTALGYGAAASAENSMAFGTSANANMDGSVALGSYSLADRKAGAIGYDYLTGGPFPTNPTKDQPTEATPIAWKSTTAAVSVGDGTEITRQITGVAAGSADTDAVNVAQLKQVHWNVGINEAGGTVAKKLDVDSSSVGNNGKNKVEFLAGEGIDLSYTTLSSGNNDDGYGIKITNHIAEITPDPENIRYAKTIRFSNGEQLIIENITGTVQKPLDTDYRVAKIGLNKKGEEMIISPYLEIMGSDKNDPSKAQKIKEYNQFADEMFQARAIGANAIALGREADAWSENALALGYMAEAGAETGGVNTVAVGYKASALSNNAVAVGTASFATGNRSIAIGVSNTVSNTTAHLNEQRAWAAGQGSIVLGNESKAITERARFQEDTNVDINANDSVSIGARSDARARNAVALGGNLSYTDKNNDVFYGVISGTNRDFGATVGEGADSAIAIGGAYGDFNDDGSIKINKDSNKRWNDPSHLCRRDFVRCKRYRYWYRLTDCKLGRLS